MGLGLERNEFITLSACFHGSSSSNRPHFSTGNTVWHWRDCNSIKLQSKPLFGDRNSVIHLRFNLQLFIGKEKRDNLFVLSSGQWSVVLRHLSLYPTCIQFDFRAFLFQMQGFAQVNFFRLMQLADHMRIFSLIASIAVTEHNRPSCPFLNSSISFFAEHPVWWWHFFASFFLCSVCESCWERDDEQIKNFFKCFHSSNPLFNWFSIAGF